MEDVDTLVRTTFGSLRGFFGPFAIADQAGLDVHANGFKTFEDAFGPRIATPAMLKEAVDAGRNGTKNGKGLTGDFDDETPPLSSPTAGQAFRLWKWFPERQPRSIS